MGVRLNHVGVGVGDIDAAIAFYRDALGCRVLRGAREVTAEGPGGAQAVDVLNSRPFRKMKMADLLTPDGLGLEFFQLIDPPHERRDPALEYWRSGAFHICFTTSDLDATLARMVALGAVQTSRVWAYDARDPSKRMVYCADPWGVVIELHSHSFKEMCA